MLNFFFKNQLLIWLGVIVFSALFSVSNMGGRGVFLPINLSVWLVVVLFVLYTAGRIFVVKEIKYSNLSIMFLGMLVLLFILSLFKTEEKYLVVLISFIEYLIVGFFYFALLQYQISRKQISQFVLIVIAFSFIQALISGVQIWDLDKILFQYTGYSPFNMIGKPTGSFLQINMYASFLSAGLVFSLYILTQNNKKWVVLLILLNTLFLSYFVFITGSRSAIVVLLIGSVFVLLSTSNVIKRHRLHKFFWLSVVLAGAFIAGKYPVEGISFLSKLDSMILGVDVRLYIYSTTIDMIYHQPLFGYGLGSFLEKFNSFILDNPPPQEFRLFNFEDLTHPHNELLNAVFQSGIGALILVLVFTVFYLKNVYKSSKFSTAAGLGLLVVFLVPAMFSYPFSLSAIHLFMLVIVLYLILPETERIVIKDSTLAKYRLLSLIGGIAFLCSVLFYVWLSMKSIQEVYLYHYREYFKQYNADIGMKEQAYFKYASKHPEYSNIVKNEMIRFAKVAVKNNKADDLFAFIFWANNLEITADNKDVLEVLLNVYEKLNMKKEAEAIIFLLESNEQFNAE